MDSDIKTLKEIIAELEDVLQFNMDIKPNPFISEINTANLDLASRIEGLKNEVKTLKSK